MAVNQNEKLKKAHRQLKAEMLELARVNDSLQRELVEQKHANSQSLRAKEAEQALATTEDITERLATQTHLQQSLALFQSLPPPSSDWNWELDDQFRFTRISQAWTKQLGFLAGDFVGRTRREIDDNVRNLAAWARFRAQLERRETFRNFEYERVDKNGHQVVVCISGEPFTNSGGNFAGYCGAGIDISMRRQAETAFRACEARCHTIVAALAEGVILRDADGRIEDCNASTERILGKTLGQMKGLKVIATDWHILREDGTPMPEEEWPSVIVRRTGLPQSNHVACYLKPDGSDLWLLHNILPLFEGGTSTPSSFVSTITDITERKRAKMEIARLNINLENRVLRRTAEFEAASRELEAFSYSVAHDLRAPLSAIDGFSVLLQRAMPPESGRRAHHYASRIRSGVLHIGKLTDTLLSLAHLSRTSLQWAPVDMSEEVAEIIKRCSEKDATRRVQTTVEPGLRVRADRSLLRQALENLIANAWKFSSKKTCACISVGQQVDGDGKPVYFVKDNGAGFDMAYADKLFGTFQRLHSQEEFSGSGIGLATVQRIINRHGGKVWAHASVEQGCTFYFTLGSDQTQVATG